MQSLAIHSGFVAAFAVSVHMRAPDVSDIFTSVGSRWSVNALPFLPCADMPYLFIVVGTLVSLCASKTALTEMELLVAVCEGPSCVGSSIRVVIAFL